jgi:hypothetical protein
MERDLISFKGRSKFSILNAERIVFIPVDDCQQRCFQCARLREDRSFGSSEREKRAQARCVTSFRIKPAKSRPSKIESEAMANENVQPYGMFPLF